MKENLLDNNDENKELLELDDNKDNSEGLKQIKTISSDCALGGDSASVELKNEMMALNPDTFLPTLLYKRTKMFKEMSYVDILKLEKSEIGKPLLYMEDVNDIETSKQMFRNLLSYMKLRKSSKEPFLHAKKYIFYMHGFFVFYDHLL